MCVLGNREEPYHYGLYGFAFWWFRFTLENTWETEYVTFSGHTKMPKFEQTIWPQLGGNGGDFERYWANNVKENDSQ